MKTVLLDVDGVIADFVGAYQDAICEVTGIRITRPPDQWSMADAYGLTPAQAQEVSDMLDQSGVIDRLEPLPNAVAAVKLLSRRADVWFVTAYSTTNPYWTYERSMWLENHFGELGRRVVHTHHKHLVRGDILVDGKPANVYSWQKAWPDGVGMLWNAAYNQSATGLVRACSWDDVFREVGK